MLFCHMFITVTLIPGFLSPQRVGVWHTKWASLISSSPEGSPGFAWSSLPFHTGALFPDLGSSSSMLRYWGYACPQLFFTCEPGKRICCWLLLSHKRLLQGLDESVVLRCEEPTFFSNFTSTNLSKGNNHSWVNVFFEALLIIVKKRKPPKCTVEEWLNKRF